jgi:hypothetical protein
MSIKYINIPASQVGHIPAIMDTVLISLSAMDIQFLPVMNINVPANYE